MKARENTDECISSMPKDNIYAMNTTATTRCITPSTISHYGNNTGDDDSSHDSNDIPHMLNPYSDDESGNHDDENYCPNDEKSNNYHNYDQYHIIKASPSQSSRYRAESPQFWHVPISNSSDIVENSPVSSISTFSCDYSNANFISDSKDDSGGSLSLQQHHQQQQEDFPLSPNLVRHQSALRPKLKPRLHNVDHNHYNSFLQHTNASKHNVSKTRSPSPTSSQGSCSSVQKSARGASGNNNSSRGGLHNRKGGGRDIYLSTSTGMETSSSNSQLPPPSPRSISRRKSGHHRRSVTLNHIPHRRSIIKGNEESRLSMFQEDYKKQQKYYQTDHKSRIPPSPKSVPKQPPISPSLSHRRAVSFPDQVFHQKSGYGTCNSSISGINLNRGLYSDFTCQSDDPALFSLLETTQSRSNGRVCIPFDVDPSISNSICIPSNRSSRSFTDHSECEHHQHQFTPNNDSSAQQFQLNPQQHVKKVDTQYRARKHRRRKSGYGSFSSSEPKLECLEEEESNFLPEDDNGRSAKEDQINTSTPMQELRRKINQSQKLDDNCQQKQKQGTLIERVKLNTRKNSNKKREKKMRENLHKIDQPPNADTTNDTILESDFPYFCGTNIHLGRSRKARKNKEMCIIM